ncbi:hypothetical protein O3M35_001679 [Rhynocoris fuscipes]|uniref:Uncharacterized protein n=1 Tax=Rhynocoris fuscipes TaxID=488301 RepID=A0AAW1CQV8_9HEMI
MAEITRPKSSKTCHKRPLQTFYGGPTKLRPKNGKNGCRHAHTGHCRLNKHMYNMRLSDDDLCSFSSKRKKPQSTFCAIVMSWRSCDLESWGNPIPRHAASWRNRYLG